MKRGRGRPRKQIVEKVLCKPGPKTNLLKDPMYFTNYYRQHYSYRTTCPECNNPNVLHTNILRHLRTNKCFFDRVNNIYPDVEDVKSDNSIIA